MRAYRGYYFRISLWISLALSAIYTLSLWMGAKPTHECKYPHPLLTDKLCNPQSWDILLYGLVLFLALMLAFVAIYGLLWVFDKALDIIIGK